MKSTTKLKDEARKHEQREEWEKAIKVYLQVLEAGDDAEGGDVELPLFNRVGDLYVRLGRSGDAVRYYEQAADRYAEAGLYNNAIALCNKALRYTPGHVELLRKLGHFSASQGFLTDARRYFLEYAEKKFGTGDINAGLRALEDFANLVNDAEVRELLGRKLHVHGRSKDAVHELKRAYEMRVSAGEGMAADALRAEILAIDPGALPPDVHVEPRPQPEPAVEEPPPAEAEEALPFVDLPALTELSPADGGTAPAVDAEPELGGDFAIEVPGLEPPAGAPDETVSGETSLLEGFESMTFEGFEEAADTETLAGLESSTEFEAPADASYLEIADLDRERLEAAPELPDLEAGLDAGPLEETHLPLPSLDEAFEAEEEPAAPTRFGLPLLGEEELEAEAEPEPLPMLEPFPSLEEEAEAALEEVPFAPLEEPQPWPEAEAALPPLEEPFALEGEAGAELIEGEIPPAEAEAAAEAPSYEPLAGEAPAFEAPAFEAPAAEAPAYAEPVFEEPASAEPESAGAAEAEAEEVLARMEAEAAVVERPPFETEAGSGPEAEAASAAAAEEAPAEAAPGPAPAEAAEPWAAAPPRPRPEVPPGGYIDLGSLVTEDDETDLDTRFVVQEKAPTGDEDRDFAELLAQFKQKVAAHVSTEDAAAHYDLGLAFKEMGLVDEAISEFQIALRAGDMRLKVYEELGSCFLQKEQYTIAEKVLRRALEMKFEDELELLGVYYHLGRAYEHLGKTEQARDAYERVMGLDINFGDVAERLARL